MKNEVKGEYAIAQWENDMQINQFCGKHQNWFYSGCTMPCPNCKNVGFYGPKGDVSRRYRACKFCGFWQEADGTEPYRCIALYCDACGTYDWTAPKDEKDYKNCKCGGKYKRTDWASDNPNHLFHKFKQQMDILHSF